MNSNHNTSKHLDKMVVYLFAATFLLSVTVFAIRYSKYAPCEDVDFSVAAKNFEVGYLIRFSDRTDNANSWEWDFNDSTEVAVSKDPMHIFKYPGEYTVRLKVNGICEKTEVITIASGKVLMDSTKFPVFAVPKSIQVGDTLKLFDETKGASTWEWRFGETASVNSNEKDPVYVYVEPGLKTISLIVNGDLKYITKKHLNVIPKQERKEIISVIPESDDAWKIKNKPSLDLSDIKEKPTEIKEVIEIPYINEESFEEKLMFIADEKLKPDAFLEYLCGDINKPIIVNGKSTSFLVFCEKIKGKNIKIKELNIIRDKGSNCIKTITVDWKKKGLF